MKDPIIGKYFVKMVTDTPDLVSFAGMVTKKCKYNRYGVLMVSWISGSLCDEDVWHADELEGVQFFNSRNAWHNFVEQHNPFKDIGQD